MKRCPEPYCNGVLFIENTEDGLETYCLAGHRFSATPLGPLGADPRRRCRECLEVLDDQEGRYSRCAGCRVQHEGKRSVRGPRQMGAKL